MGTLLRVLLIVGFLVTFSVASALADTPESAYKQTIEFAKTDNWEAFYDSFDSDSQKVHLSALPFLPFYAFGDGAWPVGFDSMSPKEKIIAIYKKMANDKDAKQESIEKMRANGYPQEAEQGAGEGGSDPESPQDFKQKPGEVVSGKVDGDRATLIVRSPAGKENEVLMRLEGGKWKIHLKEVEEAPQLVRIGDALEKGDEKTAEAELDKMMNVKK